MTGVAHTPALRAGLAVVTAGIALQAAAIERGLPIETSPVDSLSVAELNLSGQSVADVIDAISAPGRAGATAPAGLVLVDGVRMPAETAFAIPEGSISKVEVLRDGAASVFGAKNIDGVVNIITGESKTEWAVGDLGYRFNDKLGDLSLAAEYRGDCSVTAGQGRPLWSWTGGEPFGGPLLRDSTWFLPGGASVKAPGDDFGYFRLPLVDLPSPYKPMVVIDDPAPVDTLNSALGAAPSAPVASAFPADMFRGGIPPESTVLRSDACPEEIRSKLRGLYEQRNQAMADAVYFDDFMSDFGRDPAKAAEARARRDAANAEIRRLLDDCHKATAISAPTTANAVPSTPPALPPGATPAVKLQFGAPDKKPDLSARIGYDLSLNYDFALPWSGPKDPATDAGTGAIRGYTQGAGDVARLDLTPGLAGGLGMDGNDVADLTGAVLRFLGEPPPEAPHPKRSIDWDRDDPFSIRLRFPLDPIDSYVVELGGERPDVRIGAGDPRERFRGATALGDDKMNEDVEPYFQDAFNIGPRTYMVFNAPLSAGITDKQLLGIYGARQSYLNACAEAALPVNVSDPSLRGAGGKGSWGQSYDDQWAIGRVGFTRDADSAWAQVPDNVAPVVVGVIDTGLDWHHADFDWKNLWRNEDEIPGNGVDDDRNGYVDDVIGWDFTTDANHPWDHDGHGTFVSGIVAATRDNATGISGINPQARIMVLKALNTFGRTRASYVAKAIAYGADNGARILNLSLAGKGLPPVVAEAVRYAVSRGVLVIVAAGNSGESIDGIHPAAFPGAMVIAATDPEDRRAGFSNYGAGIALAAPGVDVMSLRARHTDFMLNAPDSAKYRAETNFVGADRRYYRAAGTSFAAPIVAGAASLLWGKDPSLSAADVRRILEQSARDIDVPGVDQNTGYGLLDARAALTADPAFFVEAAIAGVSVVQKGKDVVIQVLGTADASELRGAILEAGAGENPSSWKKVSKQITTPVRNGVLDDLDAREFTSARQWTLRLTTEHRNGRRREARFLLTIG